MIEGAVILLAGLVIGWLGRGAHKPAAVALPAAATGVCSCGDPRGQHVDGKGACKAAHRVRIDLERRFIPCTCQMYDGPEPLTNYYAQEIQP